MENKDIFKVIDETIVSVCEKVKGNDLCAGEYSETVKALAALVEARANCNKDFDTEKFTKALLDALNNSKIPTSEADAKVFGRMIRTAICDNVSKSQ